MLGMKKQQPKVTEYSVQRDRCEALISFYSFAPWYVFALAVKSVC